MRRGGFKGPEAFKVERSLIPELLGGVSLEDAIAALNRRGMFITFGTYEYGRLVFGPYWTVQSFGGDLRGAGRSWLEAFHEAMGGE